jgi:predicted transcriptional regulator
MISTLKDRKTWAMTDEEKRQFTHMQTDIESIKISMTSMGSQVDKMYLALMGSEIAKDGGLVGRIEDLENDVREIKDQLTDITAEANKSRWHVHVMWGASGAVAMALFSLMLSYLFKK